MSLRREPALVGRFVAGGRRGPGAGPCGPHHGPRGGLLRQQLAAPRARPHLPPRALSAAGTRVLVVASDDDEVVLVQAGRSAARYLERGRRRGDRTRAPRRPRRRRRGRHRGGRLARLAAPDRARAGRLGGMSKRKRRGGRVTESPSGPDHDLPARPAPPSSTTDPPGRSRHHQPAGRQARTGRPAPIRAGVDRPAALRRHRPAARPPGAPTVQTADDHRAHAGGRRDSPPRSCSRWARPSPPGITTDELDAIAHEATIAARLLPEPAQLPGLPQVAVHVGQRGHLPRHPRQPPAASTATSSTST